MDTAAIVKFEPQEASEYEAGQDGTTQDDTQLGPPEIKFEWDEENATIKQDSDSDKTTTEDVCAFAENVMKVLSTRVNEERQKGVARDEVIKDLRARLAATEHDHEALLRRVTLLELQERRTVQRIKDLTKGLNRLARGLNSLTQRLNDLTQRCDSMAADALKRQME